MNQLSLLLVLSSFSLAQTVAVIDLEGNSVSESDSKALTDRLNTELFNICSFDLVERNQIKEIINEQGFQQSGCTTVECAVDVGKLLGAEKIVIGSVSRVGNIYTISARMVNTQSGRIEKNVSFDHGGILGYLLTDGMSSIAAQLCGKSLPKEKVTIQKPSKPLYQPTKPTPKPKPFKLYGYSFSLYRGNDDIYSNYEYNYMNVNLPSEEVERPLPSSISFGLSRYKIGRKRGYSYLTGDKNIFSLGSISFQYMRFANERTDNSGSIMLYEEDINNELYDLNRPDIEEGWLYKYNYNRQLNVAIRYEIGKKFTTRLSLSSGYIYLTKALEYGVYQHGVKKRGNGAKTTEYFMNSSDFFFGSVNIHTNRFLFKIEYLHGLKSFTLNSNWDEKSHKGIRLRIDYNMFFNRMRRATRVFD